MNSTTSRLLSAAFVLLAPIASLQADDYTWNLPAGGAWDTGTPNWTGAGSTWVNSAGNNATFSLSTGATVNLGVNIVAGTLFTNGGGTVNFTGGSGTSIDVSFITTAGSTGSSGSIDMSKVITGNHDLTIHSTGSGGSQGRLNLKVAANYTGNTFLTGTAYLLIDGSPDNILPTATNVSMASGTTLRLAKSGSQLLTIASLSGAGTVASQTVSNQQHKLVINTSSANTAQTFSGTLSNATSTLNLEISGSGTQTISGTAKTYSGSTTISGGTLILASTLTNTSVVNVTGGRFQTSGANLSLGNVANFTMSLGTVDLNGVGTVGKLTLASGKNFTSEGGIINFDLVSLNGSDQIVGSGASAFSLTDTTLALSGLTSVAGSYQLFTGFTGNTVSNVTITGLSGGFTGSLDTNGLLTVSAIPEPSTYAALAGAALLGLAAFRRRRA
ncbi:MAG: autotransporter-associated beta strand repeat-containing protein [Rariglobus sp.]